MSETPKPKPRRTTVKTSDMEYIKEQLANQNTLLTKLNQTVIGDAEYGVDGLVKKVREHEKFIENEAKLKAKFIGGAVVVGTVWTLLLRFWDVIFPH